jgi:hypothetical protein
MNEPVVVRVVGSEPEAELLCSLGAADGMPGGPYELVVRPQDLDDARDILRERSDRGGQ